MTKRVTRLNLRPLRDELPVLLLSETDPELSPIVRLDQCLQMCLITHRPGGAEPFVCVEELVREREGELQGELRDLIFLEEGHLPAAEPEKVHEDEPPRLAWSHRLRGEVHGHMPDYIANKKRK